MKLRRYVTLERVVGSVLIGLAIASTVISIGVQRKLQAVVACQENYNMANANAQSQRASFAEGDRNAVDVMVKTVFTTGSDDQIRKALDTYLRTRDALDERRAANPLPKFPDCLR